MHLPVAAKNNKKFYYHTIKHLTQSCSSNMSYHEPCKMANDDLQLFWKGSPLSVDEQQFLLT